ncbi:MAG: POTRA domain-containing protein [Devosia sp.]
MIHPGHIHRLRIASCAALGLLSVIVLAWPAQAAEFRIVETTDAEVTRALNSAVTGVAQLTEAPDATIEKARLQSLVRGFGYLKAEISISPSPGPGTDASFDVRANLGRLFKLGSIQILGLDTSNSGALALDLQARLQQEVGQPARAGMLATLSSDVLWRIEQESYPLARIVGTRLSVDETAKIASASITVSPGPRANFGPVTFKGARSTAASELQALVPFRTGAPFDPAVLDQLRAALAKLPRLRTASVSIGDIVALDGTVPIDVNLDEYQDPALLADNKMVGILTLGAALLLVGALEIYRRFGRRNWLYFMLKGSLAIALAAGILVSAYRAWLFIQLG